MINPSIYARFLAGQSLLVSSYALIPFDIYRFIALLEKGDKKGVILTAILATVIGTLTLHMLALTLLPRIILGLVLAYPFYRYTVSGVAVTYTLKTSSLAGG